MRKTGILMPLSAFPSRAGIGDMGSTAYQFLEMLGDIGVKLWQLLPLNPVGYGNSPYQPYSSCAGDELYISLDTLYEEGLLEKQPPTFREAEKTVAYEEVRKFKEPFLKEAYQAFLKNKKQNELDYQGFAAQTWVREYSVFRGLKKENAGVCWNEWKQEDKEWPKKRGTLSKEVEQEVGYQVFLQYVFYTQWMKLKQAANDLDIQVMGDVPFYVGLDSVDVWAGKENFLLDEEGYPVFIAGVPPDYFSATGQRWGNPIYDWDYLKEQGYQFWVDRIGYSSQLFDVVRIDHFRAFDTYWKIPASCSTAIEGEWIEAPGYEVIDVLKAKIPNMNLVAEDLGNLRPEVLELKNHYKLKGMKILLFVLETQGKYAKDTFKDEERMIIYTGTHDNDTLMQWYKKLSCAAQRKVRQFLKRQGIKQGSVQDRLICYTLKSKAEYAILPMQDILGLGKEGHMNTPGTVGSPNWEWRMPDFVCAIKKMKQYQENIKLRK